MAIVNLYTPPGQVTPPQFKQPAFLWAISTVGFPQEGRLIKPLFRFGGVRKGGGLA